MFVSENTLKQRHLTSVFNVKLTIWCGGMINSINTIIHWLTKQTTTLTNKNNMTCLVHIISEFNIKSICLTCGGFVGLVWQTDSFIHSVINYLNSNTRLLARVTKKVWHKKEAFLGSYCGVVAVMVACKKIPLFLSSNNFQTYLPSG